MADFALWATACEQAYWPAGTFWAAYASNRDEAIAGVIEADPIAAAVRSLMADRTEWRGTASELLAALSRTAGERVTRAKDWPATPRALSGRLRRAATFLRKVGIEVIFTRAGHEKARVIRITGHPSFLEPESEGIRPSASSAPKQKDNLTNVLARSACGRDADGADGSPIEPLPTVRATISANPLKDMEPSASADDADGADAKIPAFSGAGNVGWEEEL
jgi:hypothetical protein